MPWLRDLFSHPLLPPLLALHSSPDLSDQPAPEPRNMGSSMLLLCSLATASGSLVRKRPLLDHEWQPNRRDGCPGHLTEGEYEAPSYITHISQEQPDKAFGPQCHGVFSPNDISSIFAFEIPADRADANCTLEFLFPRQDQLQSSSFTYSGGGSFVFTGYDPGACPDASTTFNNQPPSTMFPPFPPIHMEPGYAYTIDVGPCTFSAGQCVSGVTSTNDTHFSFTQDASECPIGVYTTYSYGLPCAPPHC